MANQQQQQFSGPWILDLVPYIAVVLIAVHVLALVYWIYRLATDKKPRGNKAR